MLFCFTHRTVELLLIDGSTEVVIVNCGSVGLCEDHHHHHNIIMSEARLGSARAGPAFQNMFARSSVGRV